MTVWIEMKEFPLVRSIERRPDSIDELEILLLRVEMIFRDSQELSRVQRARCFDLIDQLRIKMLLCPVVQGMEDGSYLQFAEGIRDKKTEPKYLKLSKIASAYIDAFNEFSEMMKKGIERKNLKQIIIKLSQAHDRLYIHYLR